MPKRPKLRAVSLFSGCGGLDLGLRRAGFETILSLDADPVAVETYRLNFPSVSIKCDRIGAIDLSALAREANQDGEIHLLAGGPPCPPFSKSRFYRKDKPRALDDPNGWETISGFLDALEQIRPRAFLLENVKGLAYAVHRPALDLVLQRSTRLGYNVRWQVLNAADYGIPQIRERCIILGTRIGECEFPAPTHSKTGEAGLLPWVTSGEVLYDLDTKQNAKDAGHFAGGRHHSLLKQVPPGDNYLYFTAERGHPNPVFQWRSRYWSFLLKLSPDLPSWTIQARRSNNMGPFHWRNRILRISEIKRLQTFPDGFTLCGTVEQQWRQLGNAVPPRFAEAIGRSLAGTILNRTALVKVA